MEFTTIGIDIQAMMIAIGIRKKMVPNTSSQACCLGVIREKNTSTRTCSSCLSAYPAASRNIAPNMYHWISSQAFEL